MAVAASNQEEQHLQLLSIFFYIFGGIMAVFACFPIIHFVMGLVFIGLGLGSGTKETLAFAPVGLFISLIAGTVILAGLSFAVCLILTGRFLNQRSHYMFCLVMSGIACVFMPLGTILGVFSLVTLTKPSVKQRFTS